MNRTLTTEQQHTRRLIWTSYYRDALGLPNWKEYVDNSIEFGRAKELLTRSGDVLNFSGKRVLDVGTGWGDVPYFLSQEKFSIKQIVGIEPDPELYNLTKSLLQNVDNAEVHLAGAEDIPYPDNSFDIVLCYSVLEHVKDWRKSLTEMYRVLKPGGKIYLFFPNYSFPREGHYKIYFPPSFLPPSIGAAYLKLRGRNPEYYLTGVNRIYSWPILRFLKNQGMPYKNIAREKYRSRHIGYKFLAMAHQYVNLELLVEKPLTPPQKTLVDVCYAETKETAANLTQALSFMEKMATYYDVKFITPWRSTKKFQEILDSIGVERTFSRTFLPVPFTNKLLLAENFLRLIQFTLMIPLVWNYEIIWSRDPSFFYFLSLLPKWMRPKGKKVLEMHKIYQFTTQKMSAAQEQRALSQTDAIVAIAHAIKEDLITYYDYPPEKITVATSATSEQFFEPDPPLERKPGEVVYTGSFLSWKGVDTLISSAKYLDPGISISLYGGSGKELSEMQALAKQEGVEDKVHIHGFISRNAVANILHKASIGVIPNNGELEGQRYTSPLKIFEYLAAGLPIISSDLPSMREIISEPENGIFFEPRNAKDLAEKINNLHKSQELQRAMGKRNAMIGKQKTWANRAKKAHEFLEELF